MEYEIICKICCVAFSKNSMIPKMLDCGHSFCKGCIRKLLESNPNCPKCKKELNKNKGTDAYPTNFSLLESSEVLMKALENDLILSIQDMKSRIIAKCAILTQKKSQISLNLDKIKEDLKALSDLIDPENGGVRDYQKAKKIYYSLDNKYKMESVVIFDFERFRDCANINLSKFENSEKYLTEIYNRLQNDQRIYAIKNIEGEVKYGKVSFENDMILFHALSLLEQPENSALLWFDELKQCVTEKNFLSFLKLSCNEKGVVHMVTIKMFDSLLASQFISFCTGECGPTYKGCFYEEHGACKDLFVGVLKLKSCSGKLLFPNKRIDYNTKVVNASGFNEDDVIVRLESSGKFLLCRIKSRGIFMDVAGKVENPRHIYNYISFNDPSKLMIVDCGIILKV